MRRKGHLSTAVAIAAAVGFFLTIPVSGADLQASAQGIATVTVVIPQLPVATPPNPTTKAVDESLLSAHIVPEPAPVAAIPVVQELPFAAEPPTQVMPLPVVDLPATLPPTTQVAPTRPATVVDPPIVQPTVPQPEPEAALPPIINDQPVETTPAVEVEQKPPTDDQKEEALDEAPTPIDP